MRWALVGGALGAVLGGCRRGEPRADIHADPAPSAAAQPGSDLRRAPTAVPEDSPAPDPPATSGGLAWFARGKDLAFLPIDNAVLVATEKSVYRPSGSALVPLGRSPKGAAGQAVEATHATPLWAAGRYPDSVVLVYDMNPEGRKIQHAEVRLSPEGVWNTGPVVPRNPPSGLLSFGRGRVLRIDGATSLSWAGEAGGQPALTFDGADLASRCAAPLVPRVTGAATSHGFALISAGCGLQDQWGIAAGTQAMWAWSPGELAGKKAEGFAGVSSCRVVALSATDRRDRYAVFARPTDEGETVLAHLVEGRWEQVTGLPRRIAQIGSVAAAPDGSLYLLSATKPHAPTSEIYRRSADGVWSEITLPPLDEGKDPPGPALLHVDDDGVLWVAATGSGLGLSLSRGYRALASTHAFDGVKDL